MPLPIIPSVNPLPQPAPSSQDPVNFDARGDALLGAFPAMVDQINAANVAVQQMGEAVQVLASQVEVSAETATNSAGDAVQARNDTYVARNAAQAAAQAAGASAGIPAAPPNKVFQSDPDGTPFWGEFSDATKLDKSGGVAIKLAYTYLDHGTIAAAGTAAISALAATVHRVEAAGTLTITFSSLISGALSGDIELHCVNFGGKTVTWPAGSWIKADGSYAAAVGNSGVTWQAAGTDRVLVMIDNGSIYYKVMR